MVWLRLVVCSLIALVGHAAVAKDAPPRVAANFSQTTARLEPGALYAVETSCKGLKPPEAVRSGGLVRTTKTTSHFILISRAPAAAKVDGSATLPAAGIALMPIYTTDGTAGGVLDNTSACDQSFLVAATESLYVIPAISLSTRNSAGIVLTLLNKVTQVVTSLTPVFTGLALPAAITGRFDSLRKAEAPINEMLATFNKDETYTKSYPLVVGKSVFSTPYSVVTIVVRKVESIVDDKNPKYLADLKGAADKIGKVTEANTASDCLQVASGLNLAGFKSDKDKAYALSYLGLRSFTVKEKIIECLGRDYALAAVKLGDLLWAGFPGVLVVRLVDLPEYYNQPLQPSFKSLRTRMDDLMVALGQYARNTPPLPAASDNLRRLMAPQVKLVDKTSGLFGGGAEPIDVPPVIDAFTAKNFHRFGCYAEATDANGKFASNASVVFLAFRAGAEASKVPLADTYAVHAFFDDANLISTLYVSDNRDWVTAVLADRKIVYNCNGLSVENPPG